jgi:hypothetical protein
MAKQPISVTLETDNLAWLRGRALAAGRRSVSETLDALIREVRAGRRGSAAVARSVVGTIAIGSRDPDLSTADLAVRALVSRSLGRGGRAVGTRREPRGSSGRSSRAGASRRA